MGVLLILIGYFLGLAFDSAIAGLVIAILVWVVLSLVAYFQGDSILLSMSRAKKIGPDDHPR
ncbi:MAG TPA: peptidase M28, partial [Dehalococcoidia bacterium]